MFKKPRVSKGSVPLSIYVFLGLISADVSWLRAVTAITAAMVLLFWCSTNTASDDTDVDSWRWSEPAFKAVMTMLLLSASIVARSCSDGFRQDRQMSKLLRMRLRLWAF